jgi:tRNA(Arg) A34 adenosine deaminase TadA
MAGARLGSYDLGNEGAAPTVLVSSVEPCAMCLGATPWSGVSRLIIGARDADARAIGFDEGDKPGNWVESLNARGIEVTQDVLREEAAGVLNAYANAGNEIYNSSPSADKENG